MLRRAALFTAALLAVSAAALDASSAAPPHVHGGRITQGVHVLRIGRSIGSPTDGHLIGGAHLGDAPYLRIVPTYANGDVRWGLAPLVSLLDRAARVVRHQYPDAVMSVGHLSRAGGGELDRHASHESGRDADIGFYIKSYAAKSLYSDHFVPFAADGTAPSWPGARFDDARNWALVSALLEDSRARITYIFVASPLRARLLAYAEHVGAPAPLRVRAAELMAQPRGSLPHDDHFHVRIACPSGMEGCVEYPTVARQHHVAHALVPHARNRAGAPSSMPLPNEHGDGRGVAPEAPPVASRVEGASIAREDEADGDHSPAPPQRIDEPAPSETDPAPPAWLGSPIDDVDGPMAAPGRATRKPLP